MSASRIVLALAAGLVFGCAKAGEGQEAATLPPPPNVIDAAEGSAQSDGQVRALPVPAAVEGATLEQAVEAEATKDARRVR